MNPKRRAELQRRLSINAVPRPPAGLAERIKADIPQYLHAEPAPQRFRRSFAFNMRIAASVLLVVMTAIVTVHLMSPGAEQQIAATSTAAPRNVAPSAKMAQAQQAATEEVRVDIHQEPAVQVASADTADAPSFAMTPPPPPPARIEMPREVARIAREQRNEAETKAERTADAETARENGIAGNVAGGVAGGVVGGMAGGERERDAFAKRADARPAQPESMPPAAAAPAPPPVQAMQESITITASAPVVAPQRTAASMTLIPEAQASDLSFAKKENVFGISVDPGVFNRIKSSIEAGHRPAANAVDVEALVNYFAGAPERTPKRGLRLEVEASPALIDTDGEHAVLRFTIDTPTKTLAKHASTPPAASNVRVTVDVNRDVVASVQRIGDSDLIAPESVLHYNLSVTGLYAIELKKGLTSKVRVATVRLEYTSVEDGKKVTLEKIVHGNDLAKSWTRASRRHRLASLGALWGESLKGAATGVDVARRAGELANQDPKDARARELANAASAIPGER
ncbi:MAG TPA: von Willebrand factor type A domain-containing protein [Thermoanaerobaculia bacterium]|nr:von Willebrand factor type A domain-containing protein [Thermoanaerobaculia bacterium]